MTDERWNRLMNAIRTHGMDWLRDNWAEVIDERAVDALLVAQEIARLEAQAADLTALLAELNRQIAELQS